jgi:hypothetical protein
MSKAWSCATLREGFDHVMSDATANETEQLAKRMQEH